MALVTAAVLNSRRIGGHSDHPGLEVSFTLNTYPSHYEFRGSMRCGLDYSAGREMQSPIVAARHMLSLIQILPRDTLEGLSEMVEELARRELEGAELAGLLKLELTIHADVQLISPVMTGQGQDDAGEDMQGLERDVDVQSPLRLRGSSEGENLPTEDANRESWSRFDMEASRLQELGTSNLAWIMGIDLADQNNVERAMRHVLERREEEEGEDYGFVMADQIELAMRHILERSEEVEEEDYGFVLGAVPAPESAIESLMKCVLQEAGCKDKCTVCQKGYVVGEIVAYMPCKHQYHAQCIERWLRISNMCPLCRGKA